MHELGLKWGSLGPIAASLAQPWPDCITLQCGDGSIQRGA